MKRLMILVAVALLTTGVAPGCGDLESPSLAPSGSGPFHLTSALEAPPYGEAVDLMAGRTMNIGSVHCWIAGDSLFVLYGTGGDWRITQAQLVVVKSPGDIPRTRSDNPKVGHFPFKRRYDPSVDACKFSLDMEEWGLNTVEELVIAAHADVVYLSGGAVVQSEGAWGAGTQFDEVTPGDENALERPPVTKDKSGIEKDPDTRGNWAMYFRVNVHTLRGLLLWNKLGSLYEVTHSVVGPNGVIVGDIAYLPCRYGDGFRPLPRTGDHNSPNNFIDFAGLGLGPRGCIEFWFLPDWSDWHTGHGVDIFYYGVIEQPQNLLLALGYNDWQGLLNVTAIEQNFARFVEKDYVPGSISGWSTTTPFHVAFVWDGTQPTSADKLRFFLNGVEPTPYREYLGNPSFTTWPPMAVLRMASRLVSGDWNRHHWEGADGVIDNLKVWSYPKTDFSDRFTE
jgi:hypothetical protein